MTRRGKSAGRNRQRDGHITRYDETMRTIALTMFPLLWFGIGACDRPSSRVSPTGPSATAASRSTSTQSSTSKQSTVPLTSSLELELKVTALRYMFERLSSPHSFYSAYVMRDAVQSDALVRAFPDHLPTVSNQVEVENRKGAVVNKATGKPVMIWTAKVSIATSDTASVDVTWYSGWLAAAGYTLQLRRTDKGWTVVSEAMNFIS